jgi:fructokinase
MILCCGEALIDFIRPGADDGCFYASPGGSPFNTAIAAARLGVPTGFYSRISGDMFGEQLVDHLKNNAVDISYLQRSKDPSTLAFVDKSGEEAIYAFFAKGSADRSLSPSDLPGPLPESIQALALGSLATILDPIADTLLTLIKREHGERLVSFDPNIRENMIDDRQAYLARFFDIVHHSHVVKASDQDLSWVFPTSSVEEAASSLLTRGAELVLVTQGSSGSMAFTNDESVAVPAPVVDVVDTVGAGDSFHGAVLAFLHREDALTPGRPGSLGEEELRRLLSFAAEAAAITCTRSGADPPRIDELQ